MTAPAAAPPSAETAALPRPVTPVGILAARLLHIVERLEAVGGIDQTITAELHEAAELAAGLDPYLSLCTTRESPALERLARRTRAEDWDRHSGNNAGATLEQEMLSGHVEGQLLKMLVHLTRAERVLDIGVFTGYSALAMAEALPAHGEVTACEIDAGVAALAIDCFRESANGHKIAVRIGPALATLEQLSAAGKRFDLVFVDADKAGYVGYLEILLDQHLLSPGGLICADNTLMQGQPWVSGRPTANGEAIKRFNRTVAADPRVEQVLIPLRDGLTLIRRLDGA